MSTETNSLEAVEQPILPGIDLGQELLGDESTQRAEYSGKIVESNQARVTAILQARSLGLSVRQVCAAYQVGTHTLAALEERHGAKLATLKTRVARKLGMFAELGLDRMLAEVDSMDPDRLPVAIAIALDKLQVLTGEPSVIVGHEQVNRFTVDALKDRLDDAIDVTPPAMGLPAEKDRQREGESGARLGDESGDQGVQFDKESD